MSKVRQGPRRQGDILLLPAGTPRFDGTLTPTSRPQGAKAAPRDGRGRLVLAEGETTGHCHAILDDAATLFVQSDLDEMADRFLEVERDVELVHEEHGTVTIPAERQIVRRKREYEPEAPRYVAD
jgi:hypothetical protein